MKTSLEECLEKDDIPSDVKEMIKKEIIKRRQEETALRQREQRYRALFEFTNDAIFIVGLDYILLEVNQSAADMLNYSVEELVGMPLSHIVAENEYPDTLNILKALFEGKKVPAYERIFRRKNGIEFPGEISAALVSDITGNPLHYQAIVRDITERKQAEEALRKSEERFRELAERSFDVIAELDSNGHFIYVSPAIEEIAGYNAEEMVGKSLFDYVSGSESNISEIISSMEQVMNGETVVGLQVEIVRKDGTPAFMEVNSSPIVRDEQIIGMQGIAREITLRKRMEEALTQSEERFRRQFKNFPVPAFIWQRVNNDFVLIDYNYAGEKITKGKIKNLLNVRASNLYSDQPQVLTDMTDCYMGATSIQREMLYKLITTGEEKFLDVHFSFVPPDLLVVYSADITTTKNALNDLRRSEKKFHSMISAIPDLIYLTDLDGNIMDANPALLEENNLSLDEIKGKNVLSFYAGSNPEIIQELASKLKKGQDVKNLRLQTKNYAGVIRHYEIHATPLKFEGKASSILSIARDITERKKMEDALREEEERLRSIVENSPDFIMRVNRDSKILFINYTYPRLTKEDVLGKTLYDFIAPEYHDTVKKKLEEVFKSGESNSYEVRGIGPHDSLLWYSSRIGAIKSNGEVIAATIIASDITERKKAEQELKKHREHLEEVVKERTNDLRLINKQMQQEIAERNEIQQALQESEERFRRLSNVAFEGIILHDQSKILDTNQTLARMLGYDLSEIINKSALDFVAPDYRELVLRNVRRKYERPYEVLALRKDGTTFPVEVTAQRIEYQGQTANVIAIHDISERKKAEEAIEQLRQQKELADRKRLQEQYERRLEEQLQMRQRLDSLGTLAGGIAHDFNNLLAGIMGNISMLRFELKEEGITTSQENYLKEAETASRQAAKVIKQFQTLSSGAVSERISLDLYTVATEVFRYLGSTTDRLIEKKVDLKPGKYYIAANPEEMRSVLLNLGTNAVLAIEERGVKPGDFVRITAKRYTSRAQDPRGLPEGEYIHILFEDNGCGMSDEVQKRAFDPLFTTRLKGTRKGQGLGLTICYNVVTKSKGHIELESVEGAGTTVHIFLPAVDQEIQEEVEEKQLILGQGETVFIVEDEDIVRVLLERLVKRFGYNAISASDGEEALDLYQAHKDTIDVIILDLIIPKLSGAMLMEKIMEINPEVRVIISSGYSDEKPLDERLANAKAYLTKPYTAEEVVKVIKKVLDS
ncbi:MAG: PAS domain S-box protein [Promethearchaeota archaeon]